MKTIEIQENNYTNKMMLISYKFKDFNNIVCSGNKIYQLPCQIGKKFFQLKELKQKYHLGMIVYLINSKRVNSKVLKKNKIKVNEFYLLEKKQNTPF